MTSIATLQDKTNSIKRHGLMLVVSAPSGAGKTTLCKLLLDRDSHIHFSISVTTRKKRANEVNGKDYIFVSREEFKEKVLNNEFIEYAEICGNFYGTLVQSAQDKINNGEDILFDIDWQGHRQLISRAREDVASIFILPPSKEELLARIKNRGQDSDEVIKQRIQNSNWDICHWHEYDYIIVNNSIEDSLAKIDSILRAERLKKTRRTGLPAFINSLTQEDVSFNTSDVAFSKC